MSYLAANCVKLGRAGAYSTSDFVEIFGGVLKLDNTVGNVKNKDVLILMMANVLMELSSRGKFDLRDFK